MDTLYTWSAFNTEEIGKVIADSLAYLIKTYPIEKIHLIGKWIPRTSIKIYVFDNDFIDKTHFIVEFEGHSLGAHIAGSAGRNLNYKTDKMLPRITGANTILTP